MEGQGPSSKYWARLRGEVSKVNRTIHARRQSGTAPSSPVAKDSAVPTKDARQSDDLPADDMSLPYDSNDLWTKSPWGTSAKDLKFDLDSDTPPKSKRLALGPLSRKIGGKKQREPDIAHVASSHASSEKKPSKSSHEEKEIKHTDSGESDDWIKTDKNVLMAADSYVDYRNHLQTKARKPSPEKKPRAVALRTFISRRQKHRQPKE